MNERKINKQFSDPTASEALCETQPQNYVVNSYNDGQTYGLLRFAGRYELRKQQRLERKMKSRNSKGGVNNEQ